ncbi:hypothetical protein BEP19_15725 [Ammoniphilus oxalaticus]|uniref:Uncharacterized protein n=1 Tax=Ammoniphilus oxalaticus TaxID=66863 RepID=A0A419SDG8_9BACL|nr:hypothetical protein [Ammoniphilus oxalaticus]RKD21121.1 hypothetical protein BEP19_15725 [Ammoniphilus oxalaticus]
MKNLNEINSESNTISFTLETIDGGIHFFSELIQDLEQHPEVAALLVKNGLIQRKLSAIYSILDHELSRIKGAQEVISKLSETGGTLNESE